METRATDALPLSIASLLTHGIVGNEALLEVASNSPNLRSIYAYNTLEAVDLHNL